MIDDDRGFTLLELLIAVAIMTIVAVPLSQSLSLGLNTWQKLHQEASSAEEVLLLRRQLLKWISHSYPADPLREGDDVEYPFVGQQNSMQFISTLNPNPQSDEYYKVNLATSEGNFSVTIVPDHGGVEDSESENSKLFAVMIENVESVEFRYFQKQTLGGVWLENWQNQLSLPAAVKIRMQAIDNAFLWPELIVPIAVDEWSHCAFDAVTQACFSGGSAG